DLVRQLRLVLARGGKAHRAAIGTRDRQIQCPRPIETDERAVCLVDGHGAELRPEYPGAAVGGVAPPYPELIGIWHRCTAHRQVPRELGGGARRRRHIDEGPAVEALLQLVPREDPSTGRPGQGDRDGALVDGRQDGETGACRQTMDWCARCTWCQGVNP